jgi:large subunit ribosomal protein L6
LTQKIHPHITVHVQDQQAVVSVKNQNDRGDRALWGLSRMLLANMTHGVSQGFSKELEVQGVGYRVAVQENKVILNLGFSHPIECALPVGIDAKVEKNILRLSGIDKQLLGETAARIRAFRKPEPYKGKGIRYVGEAVRRKSGKVVKGAES